MNTIRNIYRKSSIYFAILVTTMLISSCDGFHEEIVPLNVKVNNIDEFLVINASIEKNLAALVQISYSEDIDALVNTPVKYESNAIVRLSTLNGVTEQLNYFSNGWYYGSSIIGEVGETYTMTIEIDGKIYSATSTMFAPRGYQDAWVYSSADKSGSGKGGSTSSYSDEWIINDPSTERNRYLFEWWSNGIHFVRQDWCIDDNRVVNANEGLRLFTVTLNPGPNEHIMHRTAEVDL